MPPLSPLLRSNRRWAERMTIEDPKFFEKLGQFDGSYTTSDTDQDIHLNR